jgi:hypothetical protein
MRLPSVSSSRYNGTRFLANARNDSVLGDTGESRGDSLSESPLLSPYKTTSPCNSERQRGISLSYFDILI